jgi:Putative Flp pilus-assembly TadE/G-like
MNGLLRLFRFGLPRAHERGASSSNVVSNFMQEERGAIAYLTALLAGVLVIGAGLAVDYGMAIVAKSKLDNAAQSAVSSGANAARNLFEANLTDKDGVEARALAEGTEVALTAFDSQAERTVPIGYRYATFSRVGNTLEAAMAWRGTYVPRFAAIMNNISLEGRANIIMGMLDLKPQDRVVDEKWSDPNEVVSPRNIITPVYRDWKISGYAPKIAPTNDPRAGSYGLTVGENWGANVAKKVFLYAGSYQLRYWYKSAVIYPEYEPAHICGQTQQSIAWATSDTYREIGSKNLETGSHLSATVGAYLHPVKENPQDADTPPRFQSLTHNRIDICAYSSRWVERVVNLDVTTTGYFWLAFVGDAPSSSVPRGGWIANVQLCVSTCSSTPVDNFPYTKDTLIFSDDFNVSFPEGGGFTGFTGTIAASAKYAVPPSDVWRIENGAASNVMPSVLTWSRQNPYPNGNSHVLARFTPQKASALYGGGTVEIVMLRRLLLTAGRYVVNLSGRGDGNTSSGICPIIKVNGLSGGNSLCSTLNYQAQWRDYSICLVVMATRFYDVGVNFAGKINNGEARTDNFKLRALYTNTLRRFASDRDFCTEVIDMQPPGDLIEGTRITYDRVVVKASWWQ